MRAILPLLLLKADFILIRFYQHIFAIPAYDAEIAAHRMNFDPGRFTHMD
jgi:hypothetical protein